MRTFEYQGKSFSQRDEDGFFNANEMCEIFGEFLDDIFNQDFICGYLHSLKSKVLFTYSPYDSLTCWVHPRLALRIAQGLSDEFAIWFEDEVLNLWQKSQKNSLDVHMKDIKVSLDEIKKTLESFPERKLTRDEKYAFKAVTNKIFEYIKTSSDGFVSITFLQQTSLNKKQCLLKYFNINSMRVEHWKAFGGIVSDLGWLNFDQGKGVFTA
jgi:hypothetical protein